MADSSALEKCKVMYSGRHILTIYILEVCKLIATYKKKIHVRGHSREATEIIKVQL